MIGQDVKDVKPRPNSEVWEVSERYCAGVRGVLIVVLDTN